MIEEKYCRCIMHVANKYPEYNPYAVCTSSVYRGKKRKGIVRCLDRYKFEDFSTEELRGYARMKNAKTTKIPGAEKMNRNDLIKALYRFVALEKGKEVWQTYLNKYKTEHPEIPSKKALKLASEEYQSGKKSIMNI